MSLCLSVILSIWPTNVIAIDLQEAIQKTVSFKAPKDTLLNVGQAAPFTGILVSDPIYRKYQNAVDKSVILDRRLAELASIPDTTKTEVNGTSILFFLGGLVVGGAAVALTLR